MAAAVMVTPREQQLLPSLSQDSSGLGSELDALFPSLPGSLGGAAATGGGPTAATGLTFGGIPAVSPSPGLLGGPSLMQQLHATELFSVLPHPGVAGGMGGGVGCGGSLITPSHHVPGDTSDLGTVQLVFERYITDLIQHL